MKKTLFRYISLILAPAMLLLTGCSRELDLPESGVQDHCIELTLGGLNHFSETKATIEGDDAYNENLVESVDCFFYPNGQTDSPAVFTAIGRGAEAVTSGGETVYKVKVFFTDTDAQKLFGSTVSGTCQVFVVCNAPLSYGSDTSVPALKELVVENDFTAQTVQSSFVMSADAPGTVTLTTVGETRSAAGRVEVSRAAAKIQFFLMIPDIFTDETDQFWEPVLDAGVSISYTNAVKRGKVDGNYTVKATDYVNYGSRSVVELDQAQLITGYEDYTYSHVPFYSYPCAWSDLSDYAASVVFRIAWRIKDTEDYQWKKYQLSPNISTQDLKRNHCYRMFVKVRSLGGADQEHEVIIPEADYVIIPWINESASGGQGIVPGELITYKYLVVDEPDQVLNNEETAYFTYVTSSPLSSIKISKIEYYNNMLATPLQTQTLNTTITDDNQTVSTYAGDIKVSKETPGLVTFYHSLSNIYSAVKIYATITNGDACTQDVVLVQNPSIQLIRQGSAGDVFINGYFGRVKDATYATGYYPYIGMESDYIYFPDLRQYYRVESNGNLTQVYNPGLSGGVWVNAGTVSGYTYQRYYYTDNSASNHYYHCATNWTNGGQQISDAYNAGIESGTYGTILGSIASLNESIDRNFYTTLVSVSSFNDANDFYIANSTEIHYRIGDPRKKASEFYFGGTSWDTVTNFYKYLYYSGSTETYEAWSNPGDILICSQSSEDQDIISPKLLVSSALNANSGLTFDKAVKRGATYQEAGYPAGRWRLPSEAEIAFIVARQRDGIIPNLYATDTYYWSGSGRLVYIPKSDSTPITFYTEQEGQDLSGDTTFSCRFVYDLWYWGDEAASTNVYHPNGHNTDY